MNKNIKLRTNLSVHVSGYRTYQFPDRLKYHSYKASLINLVELLIPNIHHVNRGCGFLATIMKMLAEIY